MSPDRLLRCLPPDVIDDSASIGLVGLGVMGQAFGENLLTKGFGLVVYDANESTTQAYSAGHEACTAASSIEELVAKLPAPRKVCLLYTSPSPRDLSTSRMPSSA